MDAIEEQDRIAQALRDRLVQALLTLMKGREHMFTTFVFQQKVARERRRRSIPKTKTPWPWCIPSAASRMWRMGRS